MHQETPRHDAQSERPSFLLVNTRCLDSHEGGAPPPGAGASDGRRIRLPISCRTPADHHDIYHYHAAVPKRHSGGLATFPGAGGSTRQTPTLRTAGGSCPGSLHVPPAPAAASASADTPVET